jgi:hypothetical protein
MVEFHSLDFFIKKSNCKLAPIVICHMFLDALRISWYMNNFFNWKPLCMSKYNKGQNKKFKIHGQRVCHVHGYCKIVNVLKIINLHYSQVVWLECTPCMIIFSHNKLMATYKKLTPSLQLLPLFNYNLLLFVMCFFYTLRICWYIKIFLLKVVLHV